MYRWEILNPVVAYQRVTVNVNSERLSNKNDAIFRFDNNRNYSVNERQQLHIF